ncbi:MAG: hypothetical protein IK126_02755 [Bacteroidales bacterium]|nr:hypothetical protein [Bacteroidales bacterium]
MINMDNYEGYLYLYQEGELDSTTRTEVERFLLEHPDIREEMETYYDPTLVVTAEPPARKTRRIVPLWRWAAAACVVFALGYGIWTTTSTTVGTGDESLVAENKPIQIQPKTSDTPTTDQISPISSPASANRRIQRINPSLPSTNKSILNVQPQETDTETTVPAREAIEPAYTEPTIIYCQLAEEIIPVDNLAEEIIFVDNLAEVKTATSINEMIIDFADNRRQQFINSIKDGVITLVTKEEKDKTI